MADTAREQAINAYIRNDPFARHLGATVEIVAPGHSRVTMTVTDEMVNFHGMTHGGLIFTLGDIAFAAAGNSRGQTAVALNVDICFLRASKPGDVLVAEAKEQFAGGPTALYDITVINRETGELIAKSLNMVYRKKEWFVPEDGAIED